MDFEKLSREAEISLRKVRLLVKLMRKYGYLPAGDHMGAARQMKQYMQRGQGLSVQQMVMLIEEPALLKTLGEKKITAEAAIRDLDRPELCKVDSTIVSTVWSAAGQGEDKFPAAEQLASWIKSVIPAKGCGHHYLATRIVLAVAEQDRNAILKRIHFAFMAVRKLPSFDGWFSIKAGIQNETIYHQPKAGKLDL